MRGATCAIFMMTFNLREVTKKRLGARGLGAERATGARPDVGAMSHHPSR